jgi:hypothetical protein
VLSLVAVCRKNGGLNYNSVKNDDARWPTKHLQDALAVLSQDQKGDSSQVWCARYGERTQPQVGLHFILGGGIRIKVGTYCKHTHSFVISSVRCYFFISCHSNESEYYSSGALLLLSQRVLLNFVTDSGYHEQRNKRAFTVFLFLTHRRFI